MRARRSSCSTRRSITTAEGLSLYALGQIDLAHRARIDDLFYAIAHARARRA